MTSTIAPSTPTPRPGAKFEVVLLFVLMTFCTSVAKSFGSEPSTAQSSDAATVTHQLDIPADSLDRGLNRLADVFGLQLVYDAQLARNIRSNRLRGNFTAEKALQQLLEGTGLTGRFTSANSVTLEKSPVPSSSMTQKTKPVAAQEPQSEPAIPLPQVTVQDTRDQGYKAGETTVGSKIPLTLREIPNSVSVITRQQMDDQNLIITDDAYKQTTGISRFSYGFGVDSVPFARGHRLEMQYDGIPDNFRAGYFAQRNLAVFERVEVLRGPSGLLQGSGNPGGTINLVRKRALDRFTVGGSLSGGSWNNFNGDVDVNTPLNASGSVRVRGVLAGQNRDYFFDVANTTSLTGYGILEVDLTPRTTLAFSGVYQEDDDEGYTRGFPTDTSGKLLKLKRSTYIGEDWNRLRTKTHEGFVELVHRFYSDWQAKAAFIYRDQKSHGPWASTAGAVDTTTNLVDFFAAGPGTNDHFKSISADFNVGGPIELFGRKHHLLAGYNLANLHSSSIGYGGMFFGRDLLRPEIALGSVPGDVQWSFEDKLKQSGFYTMARVKVLDPLTVIGGGRWTDFTVKSRDPILKGPWEKSTAKAHNEFTPYGGLIWDITKQFSLYGSYADIFIPQSQVAFGGKVLDPLIGWQAETGIKGEFFDGRLNATVALFRVREKNRAFLDPVNFACPGGFCYLAAGETQSQGWETEINGSPLRGWDITAGYTYTETKFLKDENPDNVGKPFSTDTPRHLFKLWSKYRFSDEIFSGWLSGWSVGGGLYAQSHIYRGEKPTKVDQGGYVTTSAQAGYRFNEKLNATLTVNNLFDRKYYESIDGFYGTNFYGEPRSVMLTLRARF